MKKFIASVGLLIALFVGVCHADELTFNFVNLSNATFIASSSGLSFGNATNIQVTDNSTGSSFTFVSLDSGFTGAATFLSVSPLYEAEYGPGGSGSVMIATGGTTFLSGTMDDKSRFGADYPNGSGAFLGEFHVTFLNPVILSDLGLSGDKIDPIGSVSLTVGETSLSGTTLNGVLGGGAVTIEVTPIPETSSILLLPTGLLVCGLYIRKKGGAADRTNAQC